MPVNLTSVWEAEIRKCYTLSQPNWQSLTMSAKINSLPVRKRFETGLVWRNKCSNCYALQITKKTVWTDHNKSYEVNPVPERMRVLYVIHYVHPSGKTYHLYKGNSSRSNITIDITAYLAKLNFDHIQLAEFSRVTHCRVKSRCKTRCLATRYFWWGINIRKNLFVMNWTKTEDFSLMVAFRSDSRMQSAWECATFFWNFKSPT